jgi:hypothetical protein
LIRSSTLQDKKGVTLSHSSVWIERVIQGTIIPLHTLSFCLSICAHFVLLGFKIDVLNLTESGVVVNLEKDAKFPPV